MTPEVASYYMKTGNFCMKHKKFILDDREKLREICGDECCWECEHNKTKTIKIVREK